LLIGKNKIWIWKARNLLLKGLLSGRGTMGREFMTDNYGRFHRLTLEKQLFTGKDLTFSIEQ
jgi:hypothetical protein